MATKKKASPKKSGALQTAAIATAAVGAIAGAVFLYGTDAGAKKRKQIKSWTLKAKGEVLEKLERAKEVNETVYKDIVSAVMKKYEKVKDVDAKALGELAGDLHKNWKHIKTVLGGSAKSAKKSVKKAAKKVVTAPKN
jgi:TPP-dependent trihydroxycyclohexane-1,2-dione (THcHDO) dehydratase